VSFGPNREIRDIDSIRYMIGTGPPTYPPMTGAPKARDRHMNPERPLGLPDYWREIPTSR
jgi:hypothetical protein